jgi:hypothetical protein
MGPAAALAVALLGLGAAGCGDSASVALPTPTPTSTAPARAPGTGPAIPGNYAGLGALGDDFARAHQESAVTRGRGVPLVSGVVVDRAGRVTAYEVEFNDRPARSDYERLVSAAGISDLPRDRITLSVAADCLVYGSPALKPLIGVSYVRVTTVPRTASAAVQSTAAPRCSG